MEIPRPEAAREHKFLLLMLILDILEKNTDSTHPITQKKLLEIIEKQCGFMPSRTTISDDLDRLITAGFPIEKGRRGVYYDGHSLSDGELRFLIDSILYSDLMSQDGASEMIETLASLGSVELQSAVRKQKSRVSLTRKNPHYDFFLTIEYIQQAIHDKKQISCNYITYRPDLTEEKVYAEDIAVNPYDLVYKNGKYYLLGALDDGDQMISWRVDRLRKVTILKKHSREIPLMKEISAYGGMNKYVETQPDLCGGVVEPFKVQCLKTAIDEIVDAFGDNFSIAPEQNMNRDEKTIILSVKATRESMKAWSFTHAGSMVVIAPEDFRAYMKNSIRNADIIYSQRTDIPYFCLPETDSFNDAIRLQNLSNEKSVIYNGDGWYLGVEKATFETVDLTLLSSMQDIESLRLYTCTLVHPEYLKELPKLSRLDVMYCKCSIDSPLMLSNIKTCKATDIEIVLKLCDISALNHLVLRGERILDLSFLKTASSLRRLELLCCTNLTDCSALQYTKRIQTLVLRECENIMDYTFLKNMPTLKKVYIKCTDMEQALIDQIKTIQEQRGFSIQWIE